MSPSYEYKLTPWIPWTIHEPFRNLCLSEVAFGTVRRVRQCTYVLLASGSVGVLVGLRGEEIHVGDAVEEGLVELSSDASFRGRSEGLSGGDESDGNDGGSLHDGIFLEIMKKG